MPVLISGSLPRFKSRVKIKKGVRDLEALNNKAIKVSPFTCLAGIASGRGPFVFSLKCLPDGFQNTSSSLLFPEEMFLSLTVASVSTHKKEGQQLASWGGNVFTYVNEESSVTAAAQCYQQLLSLLHFFLFKVYCFDGHPLTGF